ncbi:MAG TPA: cell division protein FtsQ/DivIB [Oleiagrimonas sp.]|nr:cell division protein FtsQ/DivIB [Oleiagrimonas sp.]
MSSRIPVRLIGWLVALVLVALPLVGLMQGWFASSSWPIRKLTVHAEYDHVSAEAIRAAVLPTIGEGFFATRLERVQDALDALPWVASAQARKRWPDTLVITIHERQPFAHWDKRQLVDRRGKLFSVPDAAEVTGLPHLSGPQGRLHDVLEFYSRVGHKLQSVGLHITGAHLDSRGGWRLDLANGAQLVIGRVEPRQRLARFISVYRELAGTHKQAFTYADLRYTNGFAVRWPQSTPAAGAAGGASRT